MNPRTKSQDIRDLSQNDIRELVAELGQPAFRAKQLIDGSLRRTFVRLTI